MALFDYYDGKIPDYYDTMYLDGYTPEQILYSAHRQMIRQYEERNGVGEFKIVSEVKIK